MTSHVSKDCPQGTSPLCFHYNQVGHKTADYLYLVKRAARAPAPPTLRVTNGLEGRVEVHVVRNRALQSRAEEIQVPLVHAVDILF